MRFWRRVGCLLWRRCRLFEGDEFTEYLKAQQKAARTAAGEVRRERMRATGNFMGDAFADREGRR